MIFSELDRAVSHMSRQAGALAAAQDAAGANDFATMARNLQAAAQAAMASAGCLMAAARVASSARPETEN